MAYGCILYGNESICLGNNKHCLGKEAGRNGKKHLVNLSFVTGYICHCSILRMDNFSPGSHFTDCQSFLLALYFITNIYGGIFIFMDTLKIGFWHIDSWLVNGYDLALTNLTVSLQSDTNYYYLFVINIKYSVQ